jgi:hypothetical protein
VPGHAWPVEFPGCIVPQGLAQAYKNPPLRGASTYNLDMRPNVQARLDRRSQLALEELVRRLGWSPSRVVREGLRLLAACYGKPSQERVIGIGRFASQVPDLGSNKKHLRGFGR